MNDRALLVEHRWYGFVLQDDAHERVGDRLVELPALGAEADGQRNDLRVFRAGLLGHRICFELQALVEVRRHRDADNREEAVLAEREDLGLGLEQVIDERLRAGLVRRGLRDAESDHDTHVIPALRAGRCRDGDEVVRLRLQNIDEPGDVVDAEPDLTRLQRLRKLRVGRRLRVRVLPKLLHVVPHRDRVRALVCRDEPACVRRIEIALDQAMDETIRRQREAELLLSGLVGDVLGPSDELRIGERVDVRACRQVLQRLLARDHEVGRLHPRDVNLRAAADLTEGEHVLRDLLILVLVRDLRDVVERTRGDEGGELAVLDADQADLLLTAGLRFRGNSVEDHRALIGNEIHRGALIRSQDLLAHVLLFGDRAELRRGEDEGLALIDRPSTRGCARCGASGHENRCGRHQRRCA